MTISLSGELIVSRYVAESITTDAGRFAHVGRQLAYITRVQSLNWIHLRLAIDNASLMRNLVKQARVLQLYSNHLESKEMCTPNPNTLN